MGVKVPFCVNYDGHGGFCGAICETSEDCPLGYGCEIVEGVEGQPGRQCIRLSSDGKPFGTCPCSKAASARLLYTTCWLPQKDDGGQVVARCKGHRTCATSGLNACTLKVGAGAQCIDVQCEGKNDGDSCDDGDPCTQTDTCTAGSCTGSDDTCPCHVTADCADLEDGNPCTGTLYCDTKAMPHACKANPATVINCTSAGDTACNKNTCQAKTGTCAMTPVAADAPCPGGVKCMKGACDGQGECALSLACECTQDTDCAAKEDGDLCNGKLYCDTTQQDAACVVHPATVVTCKSVDDTDCKKNTCQPKTGDCAPVALPEGTTCSDGDECTTGDACAKGACAPGKPTCVCDKDADCAVKDDGDLCNGIPFCNQATGACQPNPASVVTCQSVNDSACAISECVAKTGKCQPKAAADGVPCDDDNPCTDGDACAKGECVSGTTTCKCANDADCAKQDDGNLCNGTMYCAKGDGGGVCKPNPASVIHCQSVDDTDCLRNRCDAKTGKCAMTPEKDGQSCDDDNACTPVDGCAKGQCLSPVNICECTKQADCAAKEDGDPCNGTLYCDLKAVSADGKPAPKCKVNPASVVTCPVQPAAPCLVSACQVDSGKCATVKLKEGAPCDDGDACSAADHCVAGSCSGDSICACAVNADCAKFDDGDLCNGLMYCHKNKDGSAVCKPNPGSVVGCPPAKALCTINQCDPATGKCVTKAAPDGAKCSDGNACTAGDGCTAGKCVGLPGAATSCDDGNACTADLCDKATGKCVSKAKADGAGCDDGDGCTTKDACKAGACVSLPKAATACDDGKPCTADLCDKATGKCVHGTAPDGTACSSGACTAADICKNGKCQSSGKPKLYHGTLTIQKPTMGSIISLARLSSGQLVAGVIDRKTAKFNVAIAHLDESAVVTGYYVYPKADTQDGRPLVIALPDDGVAMLSYIGQPNGGKRRFRFLVVNKALSTSVDMNYAGIGAGNDMPADLVRMPDGSFLLAGSGGKPAGLDALLLHVGSGGLQKGKRTWDGGKEDAVKAVAVTAAGTAVALVHQQFPAGAKDHLAGLNASLGTAWMADLGPSAVDFMSAQDLVALPDGFVLTADSKLVRLGAKGKLLWQRQYADVVMHRVLPAGAGFAIGGRAASNGGDLWLARVDGQGLGLWHATAGGPGDDRALALLAMPGGGWLAGGIKAGAAGKPPEAYLVRSDAWGKLNCPASGLCHDKTFAACDDDKVCTTDSCHAGLGVCLNDNNTVPCEDGDDCTTADKCVAGACKAGPDRLFVADLGGYGGVQAMVKTTSGYAVFAGQKLVRVDEAGKVPYAKTLGGAKVRLAALPNGRVAMSGWAGGGGGVWRLLEANNNLVAEFHWKNHKQSGAVEVYTDVLAHPAGGFFLLGHVYGKGWGSRLGHVTKTSGAWKEKSLGFYSDSKAAPARLGLLPGGDILMSTHGGDNHNLHRRTVAGKTVWDIAVGGQKPDAFYPTAITATSDSKIHAAGVRETIPGDPLTAVIWLATVDGAGKPLWLKEYEPGVAWDDSAGGVVAVPGGLVLLGQSKPKIGDTLVHLLRLKDDGTSHWSRVYPGKAGRGLVSLPGGDLVFGTAGPDRLRRVDAWGYESCKDSTGCASAANVTCSDGNACTHDLCKPGKGCTHAATALPCSDGNACTVDDTCAAKKCAAGKAKTCDDANACTADSCDAKTGKCSHVATKEGQSCGSAKVCSKGVCKATWAVGIAAAGDHTCALHPDGKVSCWGKLTYVSGDQAKPVPLGALSDVHAIASGDAHDCAVHGASKSLSCWGDNTFGQLGNKSTAAAKNPVKVTLPKATVEVRPGGYHTCSRDSSGTAYCWGYGATGLMGDGSTSQKNTQPHTVKALTAQAIASGSNHACAITTDGKVMCWGSNNNLQAAAPAGGPKVTTPVQVGGIQGANAIGAGANHNCAAWAGQVGCWGFNSHGQSGADSAGTTKVGKVQPVSGVSDVIAIAGGDMHTCALSAAGLVSCWGANGYGQLGVGSKDGGHIASKVALPGNAVALDCGKWHTCAVLADGRVFCWGRNHALQTSGVSQAKYEQPTLIPASAP